MKAKLTYTDNYALIVDESEIKEGDWYYFEKIVETIYKRGFYRCSCSLEGERTTMSKYCKKITWHLPLNGLPELEGVPLLPPMEQPKMPTEFEFETKDDYEYDYRGKRFPIQTPKTITLPNGNIQAVGRYL